METRPDCFVTAERPRKLYSVHAIARKTHNY